MTAHASTDALAVYIHWPFCLAKCPYCDFNSHVREGVDQARWRAALLRELDHYAAETSGRTVGSVFFGGGTPSLMPPETVAALLDRIAAHWRLAPDVEITLEANPTSVEASRFAALRRAGVNRVSLGVQALDDAALAGLGRRHGAAEALDAVALARRHFPRFSFDLIYARPGQSVADWRGELTRALDHAGDHLSVYQLTIEPGTAYHARHRRGDLVIPDEDTAAALYEETQAILDGAGLPAYEISNHARPGGESRHNLVYWSGGDWVGIGPGAHGRLTLGAGRIATRQARAPETWLMQVEADGHGTAERLPVDPAAVIEELLLMGLRLTAGISRDRFRRVAGQEIERALDARRLADLREEGYLELDHGGLRATRPGRERLNAVLEHLLGG